MCLFGTFAFYTCMWVWFHACLVLVKQLTHWGDGVTPSVSMDCFCKGLIESVGLVFRKWVKHVVEDGFKKGKGNQANWAKVIKEARDAQTNQWQLELKLLGVNAQKSVQLPPKWKLGLTKWLISDDPQHVPHFPPQRQQRYEQFEGAVVQTCFYAAIFHFQSFLMLVAQLSSPLRVTVIKTVIWRCLKPQRAVWCDCCAPRLNCETDISTYAIIDLRCLNVCKRGAMPMFKTCL